MRLDSTEDTTDDDAIGRVRDRYPPLPDVEIQIPFLSSLFFSSLSPSSKSNDERLGRGVGR